MLYKFIIFFWSSRILVWNLSGKIKKWEWCNLEDSNYNEEESQTHPKTSIKISFRSRLTLACRNNCPKIELNFFLSSRFKRMTLVTLIHPKPQRVEIYKWPFDNRTARRGIRSINHNSLVSVVVVMLAATLECVINHPTLQVVSQQKNLELKNARVP